MNKNKSRVAIVTSDSYFVKGFLYNQILATANLYEVHLIVNANKTELVEIFGLNPQIYFHNFNIKRNISLINDFFSLLRLILFFIIYRPEIVHSTTPKAGLLSMLASVISFIPLRIHTFTGQVWQTKIGLFRQLLKFFDFVTATSATFVLCDSHSQRHFLISNKILKEKNSAVILKGSIRGIDSSRFAPNPSAKNTVRSHLYLKPETLLILYMARFTRDKGALLMANAFSKLIDLNVDAHLLMIGPDEENLSAKICSILQYREDKFTLLNYTNTPDIYFSACDIFCLPSYREGFPMVLLNAASSAVPVVASKIYGTTDAVIEDETGLLFEAGNVDDFVSKLVELNCDENKRTRLGKNARKFAIENFSEHLITNKLLDIYRTKSINQVLL